MSQIPPLQPQKSHAQFGSRPPESSKSGNKTAIQQIPNAQFGSKQSSNSSSSSTVSAQYPYHDKNVKKPEQVFSQNVQNVQKNSQSLSTKNVTNHAQFGTKK